MRLGDSFDVVLAVRSLASDAVLLQEVVAALEARLQVLEREQAAPVAGGLGRPTPELVATAQRKRKDIGGVV